MALTAAEVFRDFVTEGIPSSGNNQPAKAAIRTLLGQYERAIDAFLAGGGLVYTSKAAIDADLAHAANTMAWVVGDATAANNGIYQKGGASGAGSWTHIADLPYSFIVASDVGDGTPDAIMATSSLPVSGSALVLLNIFEDNTGSPVTVSFNGGSPLTVKTNSGNDVAAGGLVSGMLVLGRISDSTFRLVSDQISAAIIAQAESVLAATEAARDEAVAAAGSVNLPVIGDGDAGKSLVVKSDETGFEIAFLRSIEIISPFMFGAVGDGIADDSDALEEMWSDGRPFDLGDLTYRITRTIAPVVPVRSIGRSGGANIFLDAPASIQHAIDFTSSTAFGVLWEGKVTLDANRKAFNGWHFRNDGDLSEFSAQGLSVKNVYRASTAFSGGNGMMVRGSWLNITLRDPWVVDCWMADGAEVHTVEGIFGITLRGSSLAMPQPIPGKYTIINPYIRNVCSESSSYTGDQDGIRVLDVGASADDWPYLTKFEVIGGSIANCRNRAIKSQLRYGVIMGTQFIREGSVIGSITSVGGLGDEINFQNGGGKVIGCEFHYNNARPRSLVSFNGRVEAGEINGGGGSIIGGRLNIFNNPGTLECIANINMRESKFMKVDVHGFEVESTNNIKAVVNIESPTVITSKEIHVHLDSVAAPVASGGTNAFVTRTGGVDTYVSGQNLARNLESVVGGTGSPAELFYSATAGSVTKSLYGVNKRVNNT